MKVLDLFAGIGGFSLAAHWMGWETVAFVEKEKFCQKVLRKNFGPDIEIHDDIFTFSGKPFRGRIDIVTGGFPCQPFSQAGKRAGRNDERHLFPEMLRVIREVKPAWVVAENVRGLLSIESGQVFAEVTASLEGEGFEVITFCIPASAVGAPHRRDRLWIVGRNTRIIRTVATDGGSKSVKTQANARRKRRKERPEIREIDSADCRTGNIDVAHTTIDGSPLGFTEARGTERQGEQRRLLESSGIDSELYASNTVNKRRIGRGKQCEVRERESDTGCGNDRSFGESAIDHRGDVADAAVSGRRKERSNGKRSGERMGTQRNGSGSSDDGFGNASDARNSRLQGGEIAGTLSEREGASRSIAERDSHDSDASRLFAGRQEQRAVGERNRANGWSENWITAAARLCRMDDGLPVELDIFGARDERVNRLKALGNSIVPQIAFEIFKAIEASK